MTFARMPWRARGAPVAVNAVLVVAAGALVIWLVLFLQGWRSVPVEKVALHYTGGPVQGEHFEAVVAPGARVRFYGLLEHLYELPATQRNYIMSKDPSQGESRRPEFVGAPAADRVVTQWESATYFKLNTHPDVVRPFFEHFCMNYHSADLSSGAGRSRRGSRLRGRPCPAL